MLQIFAGIVMMIAVAGFAFAMGMAEEQRDPSEMVYTQGNRHLFFWSMIISMITAGLLLGYR